MVCYGVPRTKPITTTMMKSKSLVFVESTAKIDDNHMFLSCDHNCLFDLRFNN